MSVVASGGSGKTRLTFAMFKSRTSFFPNLPKTFGPNEEYPSLNNEFGWKTEDRVCPMPWIRNDWKARKLFYGLIILAKKFTWRKN